MQKQSQARALQRPRISSVKEKSAREGSKRNKEQRKGTLKVKI